MKRYGLVLVAAAALCVSVGLAETYYWLGGGLNICWQSDAWDHEGGNNPFPCTTADTAVIGYPYEGGSWTVGLNNEDSGRLDIYDNVTFQACETSPILTVGAFYIYGPQNVEDEYVTVQVTGGRIIAND